MANGKAKGDKFENRVCRTISQWLVPGDWSRGPVTELPFRRRYTASPSLEGFWVRGGDLLHREAVKCPFSIECKNCEDWSLDGFTNGKWPLWAWWKQCRDQARTVGRVPLLIFTRNRQPVYVFMAEETEVWLRLQPRSGPVLRLTRPTGERVVVALLDDLVRVPRTRARRVPGPMTANAG